MDTHVVADERYIKEAVEKKITDNKELTDALETRHTVSFNPITIGSRIPLIDENSVYDLHLTPEQTQKLQKRIWHNTLTDLYKMHTTYNSIQQGRAILPKQFRRPAAIPRSKGP